MRVDDCEAAPPGRATAKDQVLPSGDGGDRARGGGGRSGRRFRDALERRPRAAVAPEGAGETASAAALAGWFRAESASRAPPTASAGRASGVAGPRSGDRVLIGSGPDGAQARIRIGAGALAGTEIQLTGAAGGRAVEARLLTHAACSRQTLSVVMDEIRARLRDRGIALSVRGPAARATAGSGADEAGAGDRARPSSGAAGGARR